MPLEKGAKPGSPGFGRNIATEIRAGKSPKQAEAIAYAVAKDDAVQSYMDSVRRGDAHGIAKHFKDRK